MDPIYNLGVATYRNIVRLGAAFRKPKAKLMLRGQRRCFRTLQRKLDPSGGYIWIHASSLGEFEQGRPLIEMIKREQPDARILLTFFSPSGYEVRKNFSKVDTVVYLPFDLPGNVKQFLDLVQPSMAIFVKYEFWGNYLNALKRRGVPTYIISSIFRPKQIFFRPWGGIFRKMLKCFDTIFVQNEESRELLAGIGFKDNVIIAGDTRFDRVADVKAAAREFPLVAKFVEKAPFTLVMGSSWPPDEDIVIPYFNAHREMKLIIAPHEFDRHRLHTLMSKLSRPARFYSEATQQNIESADCLIIDSFGLLSSLYRYGQAAYIGGGFGAGIHNINEAAVYNIPVIFGPKYQKFQEAFDLIALDGAMSIHDSDTFSAAMDPLLENEPLRLKCGKAAGDYIQSHLGGTKLIYDHIFNNKH
jgi:3-deoxy-D-manno-octulosonic-acid transferase